MDASFITTDANLRQTQFGLKWNLQLSMEALASSQYWRVIVNDNTAALHRIANTQDWCVKAKSGTITDNFLE